MGSFHAATLAADERVEEVVVWDADPSRSTVRSLEQALAGAGAAVIATPAATHAELLERCVEAGVPTFCEKPLALDLEAAEAVARRVAAAGVAVQLGFQRRFDAAFRAAREMVATGALGSVRAFALATFDRVPPPPAYVPSSGGLFRDMHIHDFDLVRFLLAEEVAEVEALGGVLVDSVFGASGDVDTSAIAVRMAGGALGTVVGSRANPAGYVARLDVYGSRDALAVREDRRFEGFLDRYPDAYRAELRAFLAAVRGEGEVACTVEDGLAALRVAEAAERSLRERRPIRLEEIG